MSTSAALVAAALLVPALAGATVGGPSTLSVLGYDPGDKKLFLLQHDHSESGELPQLVFFRLGSKRPTHPVIARSWTMGSSTEEVEGRFPRKLANLQQRLVPLTEMQPVGLALHQRLGRLELCPGQPRLLTDRARSNAAARALARATSPGPLWSEVAGVDGQALPLEVAICRRLSVSLHWEGLHGDTFLRTWGGPEVVGAYAIPQSPFRLILLRHVGITFETGHTVDVPVVLVAGGTRA